MSQPHIVITRSVIAHLQAAQVANTGSVSDPKRAVGGMLIGKRLSPDELFILAASTPGTTPDNEQLGFALDSAQADAALNEWLARDNSVDFLGVWHTYSGDLAEPPPGDVRVARKLLRDSASDMIEVVTLLVPVNQSAHQIRCFYLHRTDEEQNIPISFVPYDVQDDNDPLEPKQDDVEEPSTADVEELPVAGVEELPAAGIEADVPIAATAPATTRRVPVWGAAFAGLLLVLLLGAVALAWTQNGRTNGSVVAPQSLVSATPAVIAIASTSLAATSTSTAPATTGTLGTLPTTGTTTTPAASITSADLTPPPASPSPQSSSEAGSRLPYVLQLEPMDGAYRQRFLNRLRLANCVDCYNIDLISPVPFREMRLKLLGNPAPLLSNYVAPSPMEFAPRTRPYTLQAVDLQGNPLSEPLTFTVAEGIFYILRISPR